MESDKGSEGTGDSSTESGAEVVWPSEVIEQQKEFSQFEVDEPKQIPEVAEEYREEEFSFDSSVEIQETICMDPEIVNQIEADTTDNIDDNIVVEEFSFWSAKSSMPEIRTEQNLAESEIAHVPEEGKLELKEEMEGFQIKEEGDKREKGSEIIEASPETNEMKQQLENSEKTEKISVSKSEDSTRPLQNLLPATYSVEQLKGHILVDSSEGAQNNAYSDLDKEMETSENHNTCENFEVVVETRKNQSETYVNADNNIVKESDSCHIEDDQGSSLINSREEIELQVENVGEKEEEKSEEMQSSVEFIDHAVLPADIIEQGKMDGSLSITEMEDREFLFSSAEINMPDNETDEDLEDSAIAHKEVVEEEQQEEKGGDEQEDTPVNSLEEEPVEEVSEQGQMETENSSKEFDGKEIWPAELVSKELSDDAAWPAKPIEQEEPPSAVTDEMKQEEYISEKTEHIVGSEAEDNTGTLQNLIPSADSVEQEKGRVLDTSEENQVSSCNDLKNTNMLVEAKEKQSEADTSDDNGLVQQPDINHEEEEEEEGSCVNFQEEIEMPVKDAGEKGEEESKGPRNSSVEFDNQAVLPADESEQEKMDGALSITEMKYQVEIPREHEERDCLAEADAKYIDNIVHESLSNGVEFNIPDEENGVDLGDSEIDHVEPEEEEEGDDKQEGLPTKSLEEKMMSDIEEENEREESIVTDHSSKEIDFKVNKTGIDWEGSEIVHVEAETIEGHDEGRGNDKQEGLSVKSLEEEIMLNVEEENEREESKEKGNSFVEFESKGKKTGVDSEHSEIVHVEEKGDNKQEGLSVKSMEGEIMSVTEEESEREESIRTGNSSIEFDTKGVWPAELVELENDPVPMLEMKQLPESLEKINRIIGVVRADGDESTAGGIQSFLISNDKRREISGESAEEIQEKLCMNLDAETEGSQNTSKNSEMAMEIEESQPVPNIDNGNEIVRECSYANISQEQNNQDLEEPNTSHEEKEVENASAALREAEIEVIEKEEGLPLVENEMKLQSEIAKRATGVVDIGQAKKDEDEVHEQEVLLKRELDIMLTDKEKRMDFILAGSSKVFLLVLALTLALGLLAFAHHDHLH